MSDYPDYEIISIQEAVARQCIERGEVPTVQPGEWRITSLEISPLTRSMMVRCGYSVEQLIHVFGGDGYIIRSILASERNYRRKSQKGK